MGMKGDFLFFIDPINTHLYKKFLGVRNPFFKKGFGRRRQYKKRENQWTVNAVLREVQSFIPLLPYTLSNIG
jgi:hypothetical protein